VEPPTEELRRLRLLEWIAEVGGKDAEVSAHDEQAGVNYDTFSDLKALEADGKVTPSFHGGMVATADITATGLGHLERVRSLRADRNTRRWRCRSALVKWRDDNPAAGPVALGQFEGAAHTQFVGEPFSKDEISQAVEYLEHNGRDQLMLPSAVVNQRRTWWQQPSGVVTDVRSAVADRTRTWLGPAVRA
jgi:hypothetical protein